MSSNTESPIVLDKKRIISAPFAVWMSLLFMAAAGGISWANLQAQVNAIMPLAMKVEEQSKALSKIDVMANDIGWIKDELQRQRVEARHPAK